jgi:hypothetical protein
MNKIKQADVQYNDMKGSAAMDFWENNSELTDYAYEKGIDTESYKPIGLRIYFGEIDFFMLTFIVLDKNQIAHEYSVSEKQSDFMNRFKRLEIVLSLKHENFDQYELGEGLSE